MDERLLSLKQAAIYLGKSEKALYKSAERREVPFRRWGRKLVFDRHELDAFIKALPGLSLEEVLERKYGS